MIKDYYRFKSYLSDPGDSYLKITNRLEKVAIGPNQNGYVCLWPYTSRLHAPLVLPRLGQDLLRKCTEQSTFRLECDRRCEESIRISILIGHRGMSRLPLLLATINSVACQKDVQLECIVIEQDSIPRVKEFLPSWVKHIFLHTSDLSGKYNRSAAFNLGASHASGSILVLHDNDMLMPTQYCKSIEDIVDNGYDALNTKRYVFYLSSSHSLKVLADFQELTKYPPEYIVQNLEAGGSMAITKEAYTMIGGMDEEFVGWGGEDIDLWERCSILNRWIWGFQPLIHLWHPSQPLKNRKNNPNIHRLHQLRNQEIAERITFLKNRRQF